MAKKQAVPRPGDVFGVPLGDDSYVLGQVLATENCPMKSPLCAFYDIRISELDKLHEQSTTLASQAPITIQFVTLELFKSGVWPIVANTTPGHVEKYWGLDKLRRRDFIGLPVLGAGNIRTFLMAFYGLYPWNGPAIPGYFDKLLLDRPRPAAAVFAADKAVKIK